MASGGARARSGPAPDPNALRRDRKDDAAWLTLPVEGRRGPIPEWPLEFASPRELELWSTYWVKPQALLWERNGQELEVALHVRSFVEAEKPDAITSLRNLVRQQMAELLLTIPAMHAARIRFAEDEVAVKRAEIVEISRPSARERLRALNSGA